MYRVYGQMLAVFDEGKELIDVPFTFTQPSTELQIDWAIYDSYMQASMLVEEVYAVRSSLVRVKKDGIIEDDELLAKITAHYKQKYRGMNRVFPKAFNAFDLLAKKLGEDAADALIRSVLFTAYPDNAFVCILSNFCESDSCSPIGSRWTLAPLPSDRPTLSFDEAYNLFNNMIKSVDKDDAYFGRKAAIEYTADALHEFNDYAQSNGPFKFFFDLSHNNFFFSQYTDTTMTFSKVDVSQDYKHVNFEFGEIICVILEAILQQLITGIGLYCPWWGGVSDSYHDNCCQNKAFLEAAWSCTKPDRSRCELWQRLGCLA
jgi:hypothetical protein